jgi:hypothetical protein
METVIADYRPKIQDGAWLQNGGLFQDGGYFQDG